MIFEFKPVTQSVLRKEVTQAYLQDETQVIKTLLAKAVQSTDLQTRIQQLARELVLNVRDMGQKSGALEAFLHEYDLSSQEGIALMCLAEALLRIPDSATADKLIQDKLSTADWEMHLGKSSSLFVNASTWGLMLTGKFIKAEDKEVDNVTSFLNKSLNKLIHRSSEPAIRMAIKQAMRIMAHQFVMGRDIRASLERSQLAENSVYRYSFDMLGEAALCQSDADRYFNAYSESIEVIASNVSDRSAGGERTGRGESNSISIKLSALHPRYEYSQQTRVIKQLLPRLIQLAEKAKQGGVGLTIDAEEADRLELSLDIFEKLYCSPQLKGWSGLGLAVQAYQKRALPVLNWLAELSRGQGRRIPVRLVKGAYWDTEIKRAQETGLTSYPVFTRKVSTDVSYLACANYLLSETDAFYPQFATHNAHTVASIIEFAGTNSDYEFQRLHGMGESLYASIVDGPQHKIPCRVYAPVGSHENLLPYLVRRLLENGANTSFVNRIEDDNVSIEDIIVDPLTQVSALNEFPHPRIPLPSDLYGDARKNSCGVNLNDVSVLELLAEKMNEAAARTWRAAPLISGKSEEGHATERLSSSDQRIVIGTVIESTDAHVDTAIRAASASALDWDSTSAEVRAKILQKTANLIEAHFAQLMTLCVIEAGKTIVDAVSEVREAVDFCRYYAISCQEKFGQSQLMQGPTGESNEYSLHGRGVFVCISPWNFPVAIFSGQVAAALAAGNSVVAKPAKQTPLCAMLITQLFHLAGVPVDVLQFIPGDGARLGKLLLSDDRIAGFAFTGSTETAWHLNRCLALRNGPIIPLIAETGGQNIMIVDSSALPEQVVSDVIKSSFHSAGQRCSALRVLFLQEDVATSIIDLLKGAMSELCLGAPGLLSTDIGPVIDKAACQTLFQHVDKMTRKGKIIKQLCVPDDLQQGSYFAPTLIEIDSLDILEKEIFGPILHVVRYQSEKLDQVIDKVNGLRYGLTLGIHSRIEETIAHIRHRVRVGNIYVNRNMVGAVVGVQPFGGEGLSGTGPKAGGPNYLNRFATERTVSINTAAIGGNASLVSLNEGGEGEECGWRT